MKKYTPSNPVFLNEIDVVERADLVNSQIHNLTIEQLIGNDIALKTIMEKFFGTAEKPKFAEGIKASDLVGAINEVFQLGNEKKKKLVDGLVARGVPASTTETWESLISRVSKMSDISKDTVTAAVLLSGYTAHDAAGTKITGSLADKTETADYSAGASLDTTNKRLKLKVPSTGKYNTSNYLYAAYNTIAALIGLTAAKLVKDTTVLGITGNSNNMDTSGADAAAGEILSGKKAAVKGILVTGTMTNRGAWTGATTGTDNVAIPAGYHNGSGYVSGAGAYNKGVSDADGRSNPDSANYKSGYSAGDSAGYNRGHSEGYNSGVNDADSRVNTSSASYGSGYSAGVSSMDGTINNLNGQIAQKDQMIADLNGQISNLQSQIASFSSVQEVFVHAYESSGHPIYPIRSISGNQDPFNFVIGKKYVIFLARKMEEESASIEFQEYVQGLSVAIVAVREANGSVDGHRQSISVMCGSATQSNIFVKNEDNVCYGFVVTL